MTKDMPRTQSHRGSACLLRRPALTTSGLRTVRPPRRPVDGLAGQPGPALRTNGRGGFGDRNSGAHRGHHEQRQHHQSRPSRRRALCRKRAEHCEDAVFRKALASRRGRARPRIQPRHGRPDVSPCGRRTGKPWSSRSALLPNVNGSLSETVQQTNLQADGFRISTPFPGFRYSIDRRPVQLFRSARAPDADRGRSHRAEQLPVRQRNAARQPILRAGCEGSGGARGGRRLSSGDRRARRVESAQAQLDTANALYQQTAQQRSVGLLAQIDVNKSQVQVLTAEAAPGFAAERSGQAENQSGAADRPASERSLRTVRRCAFRRSARRRSRKMPSRRHCCSVPISKRRRRRFAPRSAPCPPPAPNACPRYR